MKCRILKKKLMFLHHVSTLYKDTLAKEVLEDQKKGTFLECSRSVKIRGEVVGFRDTQQHVLVCPVYEELCNDKNLDNDRNLVNFIE